ncbi:MAG: hypothetical protein NTV42_02020 [Chloroflexi bacterium]|nr:hypothetical protein [Chloroflexota bacterium]
MSYKPTTAITLTAALCLSLLAVAACDSNSGADVYLEGVSLGSVSVEGKPVTGLPTQNVNIVLKTGASKIMVSQLHRSSIGPGRDQVGNGSHHY